MRPPNRFRSKVRGLAVHSTTGVINFGILFGLQAVGVSLLTATTISTCTGNVLAYAGDILFAKLGFGKLGDDPALAARARWLLKSFVSATFLRFITVTVIEVLIMNIEFDYFKNMLDRRRIATGFKYRDLALLLALGAFNFVILINMLRFDWAYSDTDDVTLHITVGAWMFIMMGLVSIKQKL